MKYSEKMLNSLNRGINEKKLDTIKDNDPEEQIKWLIEQVKDLNILKLRLKDKEGAEYREKRSKIAKIFDDGDEVVVKATSLVNEIKNVKFIAQIGGLANPTSTTLFGESFIDKMFNLAKSILLKENDKKPDSKPTTFLSRLIKSPFLKGILNSTPVGPIVNGVIGAIKARVKTIIPEDSFVGKGIKEIKEEIKNVKLETKNEFDVQKVDIFEKSLLKYVEFYDGFKVSTQDFVSKLELINLDAIKLLNESKEFYDNFLQGMGLSYKNSMLLDSLFPSKTPSTYAEIVDHLADSRFIMAVDKYDKFLEIKFKSNKINDDYKSIITDHFNRLLEILNTLKDKEEGNTLKNIQAQVGIITKFINEI